MPPRKALVVVSFGTSLPRARQAIACLEERLCREMPDRTFVRAFTSSHILRKIEREEGIRIPTPEQALERLAREGYTDVLCQPLHILPGYEYEKMLRQMQPFRDTFPCLRAGLPLLSGPQDYEDCCRLIAGKAAGLGEDEALVFMGHGTGHFADAAYSHLLTLLHYRDMERVCMGTVDGFPHLDAVRKALRRQKIRRVRLLPFMIVAGDHAQNDMAGPGPDSWKSVLESEGYTVHPVLEGLGENPAIGDIFARHLQQAAAT